MTTPTTPDAVQMPPLPLHPEAHTYTWTDLEAKAITDFAAYCAQAYAAQRCAELEEKLAAAENSRKKATKVSEDAVDRSIAKLLCLAEDYAVTRQSAAMGLDGDANFEKSYRKFRSALRKALTPKEHQ